MKVTLLIDSLGFGGAQRQIVNLAVGLKEIGHDIQFIQYRDDNFYLKILENADIKPIIIKEKNILLRALKLRKTIRTIDQDVLISFLESPNLYATLASFGKHKWKLVLSERVANNDRFKGKKNKIKNKIQIMRADKVICNSKCAENIWKAQYPKYEHKISTIYNIITISKSNTQYNVNDNCKILVAARYEKVKNLEGMVRAVAKIKKEYRALFEIHWYGRANIKGATENVLDYANDLIKKFKLEDTIFLHPATNDIYNEMRKADYIALFSFMEGFPNAVIEGMSLGKPIIMSKVSDYKMLVDKQNGFLCNPNDIDSIAECIEYAAKSSSNERIQMGNNSYEKIEKICSHEVILNQWSTLIKELSE